MAQQQPARDLLVAGEIEAGGGPKLRSRARSGSSLREEECQESGVSTPGVLLGVPGVTSTVNGNSKDSVVPDAAESAEIDPLKAAADLLKKAKV
jgi:hypothetical protein